MEVTGNIKGFLQTVASYAPLIGKVLPLPGGELVGEMIAHQFGGSMSDVDDLVNKINADPEAAIKLKEFELDHQLDLQKIALQAQIADNQDRESARNREINVIKSGRSEWLTPTLSLLITFGFFFCIATIMLTVEDSSDRDILYMMLGSLGASFTQVVTYYYGSSNKESGTKEIMKLLSVSTNKNSDVPAYFNKG